MMWRVAILMKINWTETNCDKAVDKVILLVNKLKLQLFKSWVCEGLAFLLFRWYVTEKTNPGATGNTDISDMLALFHSKAQQNCNTDS